MKRPFKGHLELMLLMLLAQLLKLAIAIKTPPLDFFGEVLNILHLQTFKVFQPNRTSLS
jgi:hypothetical protein